jgi:4-hydroxy-tetrahydrodipicolinate reductase
MGRRIDALAESDPALRERVRVALRIARTPPTDRAADNPEKPVFLTWERPLAELPHAVRPAAVLDFSSPEGTDHALALARAAGAALLVGTTGHAPTTIRKLEEAARSTAVLVAPNTSLGVTLLAELAARAATVLGSGYRASIVEAHHDQKKDAPSGTAKRLASAVRGAGGNLPDDQVLAVRGGDVVGEHTIRFAGQGEYVELTHRATTRDLFARGAIHAAIWLAGREPGWYTMEDVAGNSGDPR